MIGPLPAAARREIVGDRGRYDRAMSALQGHLLVTSAGVKVRRIGWPATLVDLTCRLFDVGDGPDPAYAARRFLATQVVTTVRELSRAYGWTTATAREHLDRLVAADVATRTADGGYRRREA